MRIGFIIVKASSLHHMLSDTYREEEALKICWSENGWKESMLVEEIVCNHRHVAPMKINEYIVTQVSEDTGR